MIDDTRDPSPPPPRTCPMCGKPAEERWRPFCSKRCADLDLARWFGEDYRIPAEENEETEDDGDAADGEK